MWWNKIRNQIRQMPYLIDYVFIKKEPSVETNGPLKKIKKLLTTF